MKDYKLVLLNEKTKLSRKSDLLQAETTLNEYISQGWILQQIASPSDVAGTLVAVLYKEKE